MSKGNRLRVLVLVIGFTVPMLSAYLLGQMSRPLPCVTVVVLQAVPEQQGMSEVTDGNYLQEIGQCSQPVFIWFKNPSRQLQLDADAQLVEQIWLRRRGQVKFVSVDVRKIDCNPRLAAVFGICKESNSLTFCLIPQLSVVPWGCVFGYGQRQITMNEIESLF